MKKNKGNKFQNIEKHKAWTKKHKSNLQEKIYFDSKKVIAKKSLGQNFLQDINIAEDICKSVKIENKVIVEVGAGMGFLTNEISKNKPQELFLIEKDNRFIELLKNNFPIATIINTDALKFDLFDIYKNFHQKITIIANLPYNIGTTLVINWLSKLDYIDNIVVMLQKEVVDRIIAKPQTKDYGRISVLCQSLCECKKLFDVKPECFNPKPKVMSSIVKITPKQELLSKEEYNFIDNICKIAFSQRRKKISNVFKNNNLFSSIPKEFYDKRAEEISVVEYLSIINKTQQ